MASLPSHIHCDIHGLRPSSPVMVHHIQGEFVECDVCHEQNEAYLQIEEDYRTLTTEELEIKYPKI